MDILADKQKELFEHNLGDKEKMIKEKEFLDLYYRLRNKDENGFLGGLSLKTRKRLHKLILLVYMV